MSRDLIRYQVVPAPLWNVKPQLWNIVRPSDPNMDERPIIRSIAKDRQDGRLAPAYFSPNYKYFDQLLQTVKNKTTVLILVFKEFLQTSIRPLISVLYAKGYHYFPSKNFCLTVPKNFIEEPLYFRKFLVPKNVSNKRGAGYHDFPSKLFFLTVPKNFVEEPFCVSENF